LSCEKEEVVSILNLSCAYSEVSDVFLPDMFDVFGLEALPSPLDEYITSCHCCMMPGMGKMSAVTVA
jgi:hypothetical protein